MQNAILLHNKHWQNKSFNISIKRDLLNKLLKFHDTKEIQIITGLRRSGKSSLLKLYINELIKSENPKSILFINFDDPNFSEIYKNPERIYNIVETAEKLTQTKVKFLFLDEIQVVTGWKKYVKSVYDAERF
ncbi:MAG: AAA family ATPase [Bacteroidales bacterium]|nr:AAA family ATPase [Bacteroidales bacterium]